MLEIQPKEIKPRCEVWLYGRDMKIATQLAFLYQELGIKRGDNLQEESDLDLNTLPLYVCKVPSVIFFPFVTYHCGTWFTTPVNFIIPNVPFNRLHGKNWVNNLALSPAHLVNPEYSNSKYRLAWIEPNGHIKPENVRSHAEIISLAASAQTYFMDEIRYVYDENKSAFDGMKSSRPARYCFDEQVASFDVTKVYLEWYVTVFNDFIDRLLRFGKQEIKEKSVRFLVAGWTVNRLAIDMLTIFSTDTPYVRKWQFFGFVDAMAALINEFVLEDKDRTSRSRITKDKETARQLLSQDYFQERIRPALEQIPVSVLRNEVIAHTETIYKSIDGMGTKGISGQELLWAYRNSRHGYTINENDRKALIAHNGKIPDDLPDLGIALWHYLLLAFPFKS